MTITYSRYHAKRGPFIGCPLDADSFAQALIDTFAALPAAGAVQRFYYWKRDYEGREYRDGGLPDQFRIQKTSDPAVDPVFILFRERIGTPVAPPSSGWAPMRAWLNSNGFPYMALLGESDFPQIGLVPEGKVPMSGTLFELFEQLRVENDGSTLRVFHINTPREATQDKHLEQQRDWLDQVLNDLKAQRSGSISIVANEDELLREGRAILYRHLGLGQLDPCCDPLPGLAALGHGAYLPGRTEEIAKLDLLVRAEEAPFTLLLGVSGAGKSSLLRAGLLGEWFPKNRAPMYDNLHVFFLEPRQLIETRDDPAETNRADPLKGLAQAFYSLLPSASGVCLLYTSPSPRDQRGSRMPSSA